MSDDEYMSNDEQAGGPKQAFTEDTVMSDAIALDPNLPVVLMRFHVGGCSLCGFEPTDTVQKVADDNGIPVADLLAAMNGES